jgi:hypothetical protein
MPISNINTAFISKLAAANGSGTANDVAALQIKLKALFGLVKDLANDNSMAPTLKKKMQQLLQAQIQMIMQQIADLQAKGKKGVATPELPKPPTIKVVQTSSTPGSASVSAGSVDTFA